MFTLYRMTNRLMAETLAISSAASRACDHFNMSEEELDALTRKWSHQQTEMRKRLDLSDVYHWQTNRCLNDGDSTPDGAVENDSETVSLPTASMERLGLNDDRRPLTYVAGVDISFIKNDEVNACAACVVIKLPEFEVVHEDLSMVKMTSPYIPGFLAFREAEFLVEKLQRLKVERPEIMPQAVLVDGNGILHPKGYGGACHVGVLLDLPTVGVAKTLYHVDGIERNEEHSQKIKSLLLHGGDTFPLVGSSGACLGMALRSRDNAPNPVYVSPGHLISMDTAGWLVRQCCRYRVPEPIRQADIKSREYLREHYGPTAC